MFGPKNEKYRKQRRGKMRGSAMNGNRVIYGSYGLQALGRGWVTGEQIEAARKVIVRTMKRKGKLWMKVFPDKPITKKAEGVRMGSGKGEVSGYVSVVKPGRILFELGGVEEDIARESFRLAGFKLPVKTKFVTK